MARCPVCEGRPPCPRDQSEWARVYAALSAAQARVRELESRLPFSVMADVETEIV